MQNLSTHARSEAASQLTDWDLKEAAEEAGYRLAVYGRQDYRLSEAGATSPFLIGDKAAIAGRLGLIDRQPERLRR